MADDDDIDIYGDLTNFGEKPSDECSEHTLELKKKCTDLEDKVVNLEKELEGLRAIKNTLEVNLSSLVKTAKTEIARKDRMITELRAELENSLFRRNNYRIPKINRNNDSKNVPVVKTTQSNNYPTAAVEKVETHVNKIEPVNLKPFTIVKKADDDDNEDDGGGGEIYQPNKFASTVYGERLRRKLMEQDAAEKLQKEQSRLVALTSVKTEIKEEPGTNSTDINKDNKENQFHQIAPNEVNVENPTKKSLKRSTDEELNGHHDKRKKMIDHKTENVDKKDDKNPDTMNSPAPLEATDKKINYRLEPIDTSSKNLSPKREGYPTIQKTGQHDKYRDKYTKHRSHSRSGSRDSSHHSDSRRNSDNRSRESHRRRDGERSDNYRSSSDKDVQNKYENHRDHRHGITKNFSGGHKRVMDLRRNIDHNRRRGNERKTDRKYQARDERRPYGKRKRSGGSQCNRNNSHHKHSPRKIDTNKRNRTKSSNETFSDKSNDSSTLRKREIQTSPKVEENVVIENEVATSMHSLEEGEIFGSPASTPKKNTENNVEPNEEFKKESPDRVLDNHLLSTLSVETPKLDVTRCNYSKSPQEENIENIAGFIRDFTCHRVPNESSSTVIDKLPGHSDNSCNTTKHVAEALECKVDDSVNIANCEKMDTVEHVVEPCINNNSIEHREPPSCTQAPADKAEAGGSVNNSPSKSQATKVDTISINNVSTSYADVLLKYVRKKKKSITSDSELTIPENDSSSVTEIIDVKDVTKSEKIINSESVFPMCSKEQQDNMEYDSKQKKPEENEVALVEKAIIEQPCKENVEPPKDTHDVDEVQADTVDKKGIEVVQSVNEKLETSEEAVKIPDVESQIDCSQITAASNENKIDHNSKEDEKLTPIDDASIPQNSKCDNVLVSQVVCTQTNISEESRITEEEKVEMDDKIMNEKEEKNKTVELNMKSSPNILSEDICERKCNDNIENNTEDKIKDCEKLVPTSTQSEKKIVVARRKKRPVQLTNSSNSLTVVLSAYNVNNNRVCKSRMKTPVKLSDT